MVLFVPALSEFFALQLRLDADGLTALVVGAVGAAIIVAIRWFSERLKSSGHSVADTP